jgi:ABC-2 type transport system permease protein
MFPALMLLLFGLIYAGGSSTGDSFDRTAPGILIGAALFFSCLGGPITTIVAERESGTLRRLLLSPLSGSSYFLGVLSAYVVVALGQALVVYGIAYAFGGRFHGSVLLGLAIVVLSVAAYCGLGFFFGANFTRGLQYRWHEHGLAVWLQHRMELRDVLGLFDGAPVDSISRRSVQLEDVYLELRRQRL